MITELFNGRVMIPTKITYKDSRIYFSFTDWKGNLRPEIKNMRGAKWHGFETPPLKQWSVDNCDRNVFQIKYLENPNGPNNPYLPYDTDLVFGETERPLYEHQKLMFAHMTTRRSSLTAAEMGTGKTLATIEVMESVGGNWAFVAPKSVLTAIRLELKKWKCKVIPILTTYESLHKLTGDFDGVVFDECSKIKNAKAKRTKIALKFANDVRHNNGYVILMTGTPAPHNPTNWWSLCEVACPGFLKEGDIYKMQKRLGFYEQREGLAENTYQHLVNWFDRPNLCKNCGYGQEICICGKYEEAPNEVEALGRRMSGLAIILFKKDCLDLPEKVYRVIQCKTDDSTKRAAKALAAMTPSAAHTLILLRELSDGFQYRDEQTDEMVKCPICEGTTKIYEPVAVDGDMADVFNVGNTEINTEMVEVDCSCGDGLTNRVIREAKTVKSPKDEALKGLLDEHEDVGRIVVFGGFRGSLDKIEVMCTKQNWRYIRVDGSGWKTDLPIKSREEMLEAFQSNFRDYPLVAFIAQPGAGGFGLTLTASPSVVFYSNDFNAENRLQAEDRIHRPGCTGTNIIDIVNLPSDLLIIDNLKKKKALQTMSMVALRDVFDGPPCRE